MGASLLLYYVWTHTPYTFHFKHLTLSEYTLLKGHWHTVFSSACVPIDAPTLATATFLGVGSALHLATKFKARHFWALFLLNRYCFNFQVRFRVWPSFTSRKTGTFLGKIQCARKCTR